MRIFWLWCLFPHEKSGKKYVLKVIENERTKDLLKETYLGYCYDRE